MEKKQNKLIWKILIILILLFAVVIWVKGEYDKKEITERYNDCMTKKLVCTNVLNQSLIEWKKCIFAVGGLMNMTEEEINQKLDEGNPFYLNISGGNK